VRKAGPEDEGVTGTRWAGVEVEVPARSRPQWAEQSTCNHAVVEREISAWTSQTEVAAARDRQAQSPTRNEHWRLTRLFVE
jgi:hypothetical protein